MSRWIDADAVMERIKQSYEEMGVDTQGVWNKQLAEIFKSADVEDVRMCLHSILGSVSQAPSIDIVRCKECKYAHLTYDRSAKYCDKWKDDDDFLIEVYLDADFFCSYGERRE